MQVLNSEPHRKHDGSPQGADRQGQARWRTDPEPSHDISPPVSSLLQMRQIDGRCGFGAEGMT